MGLSLLPAEVQCDIVRYLDPVTLISISQTNTHFRSLVKPSERHFIERLLALEVLPEHGGMSPWYNPSDSSLDPPCDSPAWSTMRLACPRCRRLLHHRHFDNHAVLKLAYRKPPAATSVHELPPTSWEPSMSLVYPAQAEVERARLREKRLRRQYFLCVTGGHVNVLQNRRPEAAELSVLQECGMPGFEDMTEDEFDDLEDEETSNILAQNARAIERERVGRKRLQRRCIECRYQLGRIPMLHAGNLGTTSVPILASRQLPYGTYFDRWFPGLSDHLASKRPPYNPILRRFYRHERRSQPLTTFVARCGRCANWQELRHFRIGHDFPHWRPYRLGHTAGTRMWGERRRGRDVLRGHDCNACFAEERGREALGAMLVRWAHYLIKLEMPAATWALLNCFRSWRGIIARLPSEEYQEEIGAILRDTPCLDEDRSSYYITHSDVDMLRRRREQWRDVARRFREEENGRRREKGAQPGEMCDEEDGADEQWGWGVGFMDRAEHDAESDNREVDEWYSQTEDEFTEAEAMWRWFMGVRAEVGERPQALVEWALSSSGSL